MDLYYYLLFNVHLANKHTANVIYSCPNSCKKIFGRANKKEIFLGAYEYKIDKYRLTYVNSKDQKPSKILLTISNINSHIPFFDLEKMTKNDIIKRVNRLVPFI